MICQAVLEEKLFEMVDGRSDGRTQTIYIVCNTNQNKLSAASVKICNKNQYGISFCSVIYPTRIQQTYGISVVSL